MFVSWQTTTDGGETTTEAKLTTTVSQQTSTTDGDSSTSVTDEVTTVTDSQTQTSKGKGRSTCYKKTREQQWVTSPMVANCQRRSTFCSAFHKAPYWDRLSLIHI